LFSKRIRGAVSKADLESFSSFTRRVESFILTDPPLHLHEFTISPGTYIRLAQIRNPEAPFFPSLKHLRIVNADSSLDIYLNFLLTDSLQSIELINLADSNQEVFSSFLITLADECPRLSSIILGQDRARRLPSSLLDDCLRFSYLRELELKDVLSPLDFQLLVTIGKALPELESFILNARTAQYSLHVNATQPTAKEYPADGRELDQEVPREGDLNFYPSGDADPWGRWRPSVDLGSSPVQDLRCPSPPVLDFGQCPSPVELRTPVISPQAKPASPQLAEEDEPPPSAQVGKADASSISPPSFMRLKRLHVTGELALIKDLVGYIGSTALEDMALTLVRSTPPKIVPGWKDVVTYSTVRRKRKATTTRVQTEDKVVDVETPSFVSAVEEVYTIWKNTLTKLYLGQHQTYPSDDTDTPSPILPFSSIAKILSHPILELLEVSGWKLDSLSIPFSELSPKLRVLHLPVEIGNMGVSLSDLRLIAESCPNIVSFQSSILDLKSTPVYDPLEGASNALSHGLEILSVGNTSENSNPKDVLDIARHLFILFPYLKEIRTHEGQNKEQWMYIHSLVQLLQTGRLDDAARERGRKN
jgi:hypothetical protein